MKKLFAALGTTALLSAIAAAPAGATNGSQFTGFGAVSASLGGATVASGWDTISSLSNPASLGLIAEDHRMDMSFEYFTPPRSLNGVDSDSNAFLAPAGGIYGRSGQFAYGFAWGGVTGFGDDFAKGALPSQFFETSGIGHVYSQYQFMKVVPTVAYTPMKNLSVGLGLSVNWHALEFSHPFDMNKNGRFDTQFTLNNASSFGIGANVGAIYEVNTMIRLGASYMSKQNMSELEWNTDMGKVTTDLDGPEQIAFGVALTPAKGLTVEINERFIRWSDIFGSLPMNLEGQEFATWPFGWDDQWVTSVGVTYLMNDALTLRVGYNYGKSPVQNEDVDYNLISTAIVEHHASLGVGYKVTKNFTVNAGYGHAFENELTSPTSGNTIKMSEDWVDFEMSYSF